MLQHVDKVDGGAHIIVGRRQLGNGGMREKELDCATVALVAGLGYVYYVAAVMFEGWSDVLALFSVCGPCLVLFWFLVDKGASAGWHQRRPVKIEGAVELGVSGELWVNPQWAEEIQGHLGLL